MSKDNDMAQANETETTRPTWAQIQTGIGEASWQKARAEVAWDRYQQAKALLTASDLYIQMAEAQEEWHRCLTNTQKAEAERDAILKAALGIPDTEEVAQPE